MRITISIGRYQAWDLLTGNSLDRRSSSLGITNAVSVGRKSPETIRAVDIGVGQRPGILGLVNVAKVIAAGGVVLQGDGKQRLVQLVPDGIEEGRLGLGLNGVDGAEGQTQQPVVVRVLHELLADLLGRFDCLAGGSHAADGDGVLVHVAAGGAGVAVGNFPAVAAQLAAALAGLVDAVSAGFGGGELFGEHPTV